MSNYKEQLQQNNNELNTILEMINNLPEAGGGGDDAAQVFYIDSVEPFATNLYIGNHYFYGGAVNFPYAIQRPDLSSGIAQWICKASVDFSNTALTWVVFTNAETGETITGQDYALNSRNETYFALPANFNFEPNSHWNVTVSYD